MPEETPSQKSEIRLWVVILLSTILTASIITPILTVFGLGRYTATVTAYKKLYLQEHEANFNLTHFMKLNIEGDFEGKRELFCQGERPAWMRAEMIDAGREDADTLGFDNKSAKYFLGLREDDRWVNIIVHNMICRE
jgi:hypothetical protein